ncbi:unnamed protein product, partial [Rotaria sp. Silwood1]
MKRLPIGVQQLVEAALLMTSTERIDAYARLPREDDTSDKQVLIEIPSNWPSCGAIEYRHYSLRYRSGLDLILKNINIYIAPGEKIGIIGRT